MGETWYKFNVADKEDSVTVAGGEGMHDIKKVLKGLKIAMPPNMDKDAIILEWSIHYHYPEDALFRTVSACWVAWMEGEDMALKAAYFCEGDWSVTK